MLATLALAWRPGANLNRSRRLGEHAAAARADS
ncbi:hypothetical protein L686_20675 [Stutzerimonas stutzeri MF28]|nr:hypothetical protein L686_20675 [Stutzerimonas stutzeri MF28]